MCFNTQPPEGGWVYGRLIVRLNFCFNTQPPEGGWVIHAKQQGILPSVSTHSRPKAAGRWCRRCGRRDYGFNTQPPEGGWVQGVIICSLFMTFQHTAARRRLDLGGLPCRPNNRFQHTATRRRLDVYSVLDMTFGSVSTHSRPKAAGLQ